MNPLDEQVNAPGLTFAAFRELVGRLRRAIDASFAIDIAQTPDWRLVHGGGWYAVHECEVGSDEAGWSLSYSSAYVGPGDVGEEHEWTALARGLPEGQQLRFTLRRIDVGGEGLPSLSLWAKLDDASAHDLLRAWKALTQTLCSLPHPRS